eukprot:65939-Pelagomonas_calceolata.AAC.2
MASMCISLKGKLLYPFASLFVLLCFSGPKSPEGAGGPGDEARVAALSGDALTQLMAYHERRYDQHFEQGCRMTADSRKNNYVGGCGKVRDSGKQLFLRSSWGKRGLIAPTGTCAKT